MPERADRGQRLRTFVLLPHLLVGLDEILFVGWWARRQQMGHAGGRRTQRAAAQGQPWRPLCPRRLRAHGLKRPPPPRPAPHPGCPTGGAGPGRPAADLPRSCNRCLAPLRGNLSLDPTHIHLQTLPCLLRNQRRLTELGLRRPFPWAGHDFSNSFAPGNFTWPPERGPSCPAPSLLSPLIRTSLRHNSGDIVGIAEI